MLNLHKLSTNSEKKTDEYYEKILYLHIIWKKENINKT